ncbi:transposase [Spirosoma migulaei]
MAEVGESITKFNSAKAFAKWLGFTPTNKASGGKVLSRKTLMNKSILPNTFRTVANSLGNMKKPNPMTAFFSGLPTRQVVSRPSRLQSGNWRSWFTRC